MQPYASEFGTALEEAHHVEAPGEPRIGATGKRVCGGDVLGPPREAHDQPVAGLVSEP